MLDSLDPATVEALKYASIPVVAAAIGYGTNVLAIQMTFLPLEYLGFGERFFRRFGFSLGWQGIIPANAEKMARKSVQLITKELLTIDQVFSRLEPEAIAIEIGPALLRATELILDEVARVHAPDVWETLPLHVLWVLRSVSNRVLSLAEGLSLLAASFGGAGAHLEQHGESWCALVSVVLLVVRTYISCAFYGVHLVKLHQWCF